VRLRAALRCAAGEGSALATGEVRCALRAHSRRGPMEHRTQLEIDGLQRAEGVLDAAETFVGAHRGGGVRLSGR
jgi:hypothetical protein